MVLLSRFSDLLFALRLTSNIQLKYIEFFIILRAIKPIFTCYFDKTAK